jgi:hypothetical protein
MTFKVDPYSETWCAVAKFANEQLAAAWLQLEQPRLDAVSTEYERGRIRSLRALLALADEPEPEIQGAPTSDYV